MREATETEFQIVSEKARERRHVDGGKRSMTVEYTTCGRLLASQTIIYTRGKVSSRRYLVDPAHLPTRTEEVP
jgi:hypothetical protein